jgi:hypothetical protein
MSEQYTVQRYSIQQLKEILADKSQAPPEAIDRKFHSEYFEHYFDALDAKTIVIENGYIDRDYLDDYAGYYVRCFRNYPKTCTRLHFFDISFECREFEDLLKGKNSGLATTLRSSIHPKISGLPRTGPGSCCLRHKCTLVRFPGHRQNVSTRNSVTCGNHQGSHHASPRFYS